MVTLTQLEYIVAVGRLGNFSQAAKACYVTQPTLSMQIRKLEDELGVQVFDRGVQPVRPTPLGKRVLEQAAVILSQTARLTALVEEAKETVEGELRLGVIPTIAPYVLPLFLERFCSTYPKVRLQVDELTTDDIIDALRSDRLDIGLLATPLGENLIEEHPLFDEPFYVYANKHSEIADVREVSDSDLLRDRVLLLSDGHCLRTQVVRVCHLYERRQAVTEGGFEFESGSLETLCRLVDQGHGYTVIPHLAATVSTTRDGLVIPFSKPRPSREVSLCVHASFARYGMLEALAGSIRDSLPEELKATGDELRTIELT